MHFCGFVASWVLSLQRFWGYWLLQRRTTWQMLWEIQTARFGRPNSTLLQIHTLIESLNDSCTDFQTSIPEMRTLQVREAAATSICRLGVTERIPHNAAGFKLLMGWIPEWHRQLLHMPSIIHFRSRIQFRFDTCQGLYSISCQARSHWFLRRSETSGVLRWSWQRI